ncbi:transcriptional regulator, TetR family [Rhizobium sp. PDO1-076]|uniref:TetR/AcrR family transcriptional regulator n=1 Tax=Rhizobium sp. PDO1-076 TaxID=1125979 RepID=UPI00024E27D4|nr:TetR/AcrR family transcriptional regulator [Rhizobium sp. PDO1-076]EHS50463.1 transcriptional regulator, TetR family [Rhizobium sp. PDO1-076]
MGTPVEMSMIDHNEKPRIRLRKKPQQERSIQRLEAIMAASIRLLTEKGISGLTMSEIAVQAGIPIGSLYQFFPEKAAIIRALHDHFSKSISDTTTTVFRGVKTREEACDRAVVALAKFHEIFTREPVYLSMWSATLADPDLKQLVASNHDVLITAFLADLGDLVPAEDQERMRASLKLQILSSGEVIRFIAGLPEEQAQLHLGQWQRFVKATLFAV